MPDHPGRHEFSCGMNMFRGVIEVQAGDLGDDVDKRLADLV